MSALLLFGIEERKPVKAGEDMPIENKFPGITLNISPRFTGLPELILFLFILTVMHLYLLRIMFTNIIFF
jgi:hypothetical protein